MNKTTKLVVIGSGPAAWTAAIYAARATLSPVVLAGEQGGGQLMLTTAVENYPGFPEGIMGPELMAGMRKQAERQGVKIIDKNAILLRKPDRQLLVGYGNQGAASSGGGGETGIGERLASNASDDGRQPPHDTGVANATDNHQTITAASVIIATGAKANTLKLPGEERLMGRGVGTCAVCDAPLYRGKDMVLVIGGGDSAAEEAGELAKFVKKVVILIRKDTMRASAIMQNRIKALQNIEIWYKSEVKEFLGEKRLEKVRVVRDGKEEMLTADGVFYAIGHTPATGWLAGSGVNLDEKGYILTPLSSIISPSLTGTTVKQYNSETVISKTVTGNPVNPSTGIPAYRSTDYRSTVLPLHRSTNIPLLFPTMTTVPGVFAAGDCVDPRYRQAITAAGYGCMAALDAQKWLENNG